MESSVSSFGAQDAPAAYKTGRSPQEFRDMIQARIEKELKLLEPKNYDKVVADEIATTIVEKDLRVEKARELAIFMEESKIWQDLLDDCADKAGVDSARRCKQLAEIHLERVKYMHSRFNPHLRPKLTPGLPPHIDGSFLLPH